LKRYSLISLLIVLACRPSLKEVRQENVSFAGADGQPYRAILYTHMDRSMEGGVIVCPARAAEAGRWSATAMRMTWQHYAVLHQVQTAAGDSIVGLQQGALAIQAGQAFLRQRFPKLKWGVVGSGAAAWSGVRAGVLDTTLAAAVLMAPSWPAPVDEKELSLWQGRPLLLIAPQHDPRQPAHAIEAFYQTVPDPKKMVWLATDRSDAGLLDTHFEPIVRRVSVLLFDRWLRGKN